MSSLLLGTSLESPPCENVCEVSRQWSISMLLEVPHFEVLLASYVGLVIYLGGLYREKNALL